MSKFELHKYSGMKYESNQIISFSERSSIDETMKNYINVSAVEVREMTQQEFVYFITNYGDNFESIYFFHNSISQLTCSFNCVSSLKGLIYIY